MLFIIVSNRTDWIGIESNWIWCWYRQQCLVFLCVATVFMVRDRQNTYMQHKVWYFSYSLQRFFFCLFVFVEAVSVDGFWIPRATSIGAIVVSRLLLFSAFCSSTLRVLYFFGQERMSESERVEWWLTVNFYTHLIVICFSHPCNHFGKENIFFSSKKPINVFVSSPFVFDWDLRCDHKSAPKMISQDSFMSWKHNARFHLPQIQALTVFGLAAFCIVLCEEENSMSFIVCLWPHFHVRKWAAILS